jgi:hypothetical protein
MMPHNETECWSPEQHKGEGGTPFLSFVSLVLSETAVSFSVLYSPFLFSSILYVCMYMYVCVYVCICICMYVCVYVCMYMYVCMYVFMYLFLSQDSSET